MGKDEEKKVAGESKTDGESKDVTMETTRKVEEKSEYKEEAEIVVAKAKELVKVRNPYSFPFPLIEGFGRAESTSLTCSHVPAVITCFRGCDAAHLTVSLAPHRSSSFLSSPICQCDPC